MVIFDQLRISDDGGKLYLNAHVNKASDFDDVYIHSITIMTHDKISENSPCIPTDDYIYKKVLEEDVKEVNMVFTALDFQKYWEEDAHAMQFTEKDFAKTLFFVYIEAAGEPGECTPCYLDKKFTVGATFDENLLYQRAMGFTRELVQDCQIPKGFTDFILLWNAFKSAIETEHFIPAVRFWKQLFFQGFDSDSFIPSKGCGCHG